MDISRFESTFVSIVVSFLFIYFIIVASTCRIVHCSLQKDVHTHNEITGQTNFVHSPTYFGPAGPSSGRAIVVSVTKLENTYITD